MFQTVSDSPQFPQLEEDILEFWRSEKIYEKSLEQRRDSERFIFYEGPPTANGLPHPGHCLTRAIKDLFPRYRTMKGYLCERKGGWDTHGLPVEVEVCKELGIHSKEDIEAYGVEPFIHKCQQSVWRYMKQWEQLTERLAFWIHLEDAYVTYHQSYVESVWWSLKRLFDRDLLYQGHKIVWWWAQGGTALSSGEVGQGYREVADPSVYVKFPLVDDPGTSLLVWTTTPWTLPSNQFAAVRTDLQYALVESAESGEKYILAADLVETVSGKAKEEWTVRDTFPGSELVGKRYRPPFNYYYESWGDQQGTLRDGGRQHVAWRIVAAPFVTTESGSGIVHQAPAFGEVDYEVLSEQQGRFEEGEGPELICAVGPDGKFTSEAPDYEGRWVKDADKEITRRLRDEGTLFHLEQYLHEYPFCWRADEDPLIQYPRRSWFIRTRQFKDRMLENNRQINWLPEHIREGRFGNFLETNVDWALSRERFWGTPLPIWRCEQTGQMEAVASYDELLAKPGLSGTEVWEAARREHPELPDDLRVHKPYIDALHYDSPFAEGARMRRVPEVIDCWYDSGAMPFAQWGWPHQNEDKFREQFPADFISEALDQTRGWFYSQLAISTLLFATDDEEVQDEPLPHPFRNCIVLGLMLAESQICQKCGHRHQGEVKKCAECGGKVSRKVEKMSKKLRNYSEPQQIFDRHGADALRWYFFANQAPWNSIIYSERAIKEASSGFRLTLWNCYKFFIIFAKADDFNPARELEAPQLGDSFPSGQLDPKILARAGSYRSVGERGELDRWILSELHRTVAAVTERMDRYDNYGAATQLGDFLENLSNWWLRRSRRRFWEGDTRDAAKLDAHWTLYECLLTMSKLVAPFTPFLAEMLWRNLTSVFTDAVESVHLCDYPMPASEAINEELSEQMTLLRRIASLGRSARTAAKLKVRQPLAKVEVILADTTHQDWLAAHNELICNELNVKQLEFSTEAEKYIDYQVVPNFKKLGPKLGKNMPKVKQHLSQADGSSLYRQLEDTGTIAFTLDGETIELTKEEVEIRLQAKEGWTAATEAGCVVVLATDLTPELQREGLALDLNRLVQDLRKERQCEYTDRIELAVVSASEELQQAIEENREFLQQETLATRLVFEPLTETQAETRELGDIDLELYLKVAGT